MDAPSELNQMLDYGQVADLHEEVRKESPFFANMSLPEFARTMNATEGTTKYSAGLEDDKVKQLTHWIDKTLKPVSDVTGEAGAALTRGVGLPQYEQLGREMGQGIPRGLGEMSAVFGGLGLAATAPAWGPAALVGAGTAAAGAGLSAASGYEKSGSPVVGAIQGLSSLLMPKAAEKGVEFIAKPIISKLFRESVNVAGTPMTKVLGGTGARVAENVLDVIGRDVGMTVNQEVAFQASQYAQTGQLAPFNAEHAFQIVGGQVPFTLMGIATGLMPKRTKIGGVTVQAASESVMDDLMKVRGTLDQQVQDAKLKAEQTAKVTLAQSTKPVDAMPSATSADTTLPESELAFVKSVDASGKEMRDRLQQTVIQKLNRQDVVGINDLVGLKAPQTDVDELMKRLVDRKVLAPPDEKGNFKVLQKVAETDSEMIRAAMQEFKEKNPDLVGKGGMIKPYGPEQGVYPGITPEEMAENTAHKLAIQVKFDPVAQTKQAFLIRFKEPLTDFATAPLETEQIVRLANQMELLIHESTQSKKGKHYFEDELPGVLELRNQVQGWTEVGLSPAVIAERVRVSALRRLTRNYELFNERIEKWWSAQTAQEQKVKLAPGEVSLAEKLAEAEATKQLDTWKEYNKLVPAEIETAMGKQQPGDLADPVTSFHKVLADQLNFLDLSEQNADVIYSVDNEMLDAAINFVASDKIRQQAFELVRRDKNERAVFDAQSPIEQSKQALGKWIQKAIWSEYNVKQRDRWKKPTAFSAMGETVEESAQLEANATSKLVDVNTPEAQAEVEGLLDDFVKLRNRKDLTSDSFRFLATVHEAGESDKSGNKYVWDFGEAESVRSGQGARFLSRMKTVLDLIADGGIRAVKNEGGKSSKDGLQFKPNLAEFPAGWEEIRTKVFGGSFTNEKTMRQFFGEAIPRIRARMLLDGMEQVKTRQAWEKLPSLRIMDKSSGLLLNEIKDQVFEMLNRAKAGLLHLNEIIGKDGLTRIEVKSKTLDPELLAPSNTPFASMFGAEAWFKEHGKSKLGLEGDALEHFTKSAYMVAASFVDAGKVKIVSGIDMPGYFGFEHGRPIPIVLLSGTAIAEFKRIAPMIALYAAGHELLHTQLRQLVLDPTIVERKPEFRTLQNMLNEAKLMTADDKGEWTLRLLNTIVPQELSGDSLVSSVWKRFEEARDLEARRDPEEFLSDMVGLSILGHVLPDLQTKVKVFNKELFFEPTHVTQFLKGVYLPLLDIMDGVKGYVEMVGNKDTQLRVRNIAASIRSSVKQISEIRDLAQQFENIKACEPANYYGLLDPKGLYGTLSHKELSELGRVLVQRDADTYVKPAEEMYKEGAGFMGFGHYQADELKAFGIEPNWYENNWMPSAQLAQRFQQLLPIFDVVRSFRALAEKYANKGAMPFLTAVGKLGRQHLDPEAKRSLKRIMRDPVLSEAVDKIGLAKGTRMLDENLKSVPFTDVEMRDMMVGLDSERQQVAIDFHRRVETAMPEMMKVFIENDKASVGHIAGRMFQLEDPRLKAKDADVKGDILSKALWELTETDPAKITPESQAQAQQALASLQQTPGYVKVLNIAKVDIATVRDHATKWGNQPNFMPEMRFERFRLGWQQPNGRHDVGSYKTKAQALQEMDRLTKMGMKHVHAWDAWDEQKAWSGVNPALVDHWQNLERARFENILKQYPDHPEVIDAIRADYMPMEKVMLEMKAHGAEKFFMPRKTLPEGEGRKTINMTEGVLRYLRSASITMARKYVTEKKALYINDPELKANPKLQQLATKHFTNVVNPPSREYTFLKQLNFGYFMGFNFSNSVLEGMQSVLTLMPELTKATGSYAKSFEYWKKGVEESVCAWRTGKFSGPDGVVLSQAVDRAIKEGRIDLGTQMEFKGLEENLVPNAHALTTGGRLSEGMDLVKKPIFWYLETARRLYSVMPRANSQLSFVALFKMAREIKKYSPEEAYQYAVRANDAVNFGGGAAGRPVGAFYNLGKLHGLGGVFYSLATYTFGVVGQMYRYGMESISKLPTVDRPAARKALGQMLFTQVALGGAMSLPMGAGVLALLEQLFPGMEPHKHVKDWLYDMMGKDNPLGEFLAESAMTGPMTNLTGVDLSSRVSLSNMMGISPYDGFQLKNLIGPTGSVISSVWGGVQKGLQGDVSGAAQGILPIWLKNILKTYEDEGAVRDAGGRLIYQMGPVEQALAYGGFKPQEAAKFRMAQRMVKRSEEITTRENDRFFDTLAQRYMQGDTMGVKEALLAREQQQPDTFSAVAGARRVVERVLNRTIPMDLGRTGSVSGAVERQRLSTQLGRPVVSETQRLQMRSGLEQQLGIPGTGVPAPSEQRLAQMVDQIVMMDPRIPVQVARQMAERQMGHVSQQLR